MLLNIAEDFKKYTLRPLPTLLEKLVYVSSLLSEGRYLHWGLSRIFGDKKAQTAIRSVHSELALELVRAPIRSLYQEYHAVTERTQPAELLTAESLVLRAPVNGDELLSAHLRLVQESLVAVAGQQVASQPAA